jgi:hypothetical protein
MARQRTAAAITRNFLKISYSFQNGSISRLAVEKNFVKSRDRETFPSLRSVPSNGHEHRNENGRPPERSPIFW